MDSMHSFVRSVRHTIRLINRMRGNEPSQLVQHLCSRTGTLVHQVLRKIALNLGQKNAQIERCIVRLEARLKFQTVNFLSVSYTVQ